MKSWTKTEQETLLKLYANHTTYAKIAAKLGRTTESVRQRIAEIRRKNNLSPARQPAKTRRLRKPEQKEIRGLRQNSTKLNRDTALKAISEMTGLEENKIPVRIDDKITILIRPGADRQAAINRFNRRLDDLSKKIKQWSRTQQN